MITNYHIIGNEIINENDNIIVSLNGENEDINIK